MFISDKNLKKAFGNWLCERRMEKFWTQNYLAEKVDVSQNTVSRWEVGEAMPSKENMQKIAELFGVTVEEIFVQISQPEAAEQEPGDGLIMESNAEPGTGLVAESSAEQESDSKSQKERLHELEAELRLLKAENMTLKNQIRKLKTAMTQIIN